MITAVRDGLMTPSEYRSVHCWVVYHYGKPLLCAKCGFTSDRTRQFNWANLSGEYKRIREDWQRLCVHCHMLMDRSTSCKKGHKRTEQNTYIRKSDGWRDCRICRKTTRKLHYKRTGK